MGAALVWLAVVLATGAVAGGARRAGGWALTGAAGALTAAVARLAWAFAAEDWTLRYVADNTRSGVSPVLRVAGLWAGPEGSLLLWTAALAWAAVIAARVAGGGTPAGGVAVADGRVGGDRAAAGWARRLGGGLVAAYALVVALAASPFERLALPAVDGLGLQPVLEHPAMMWHPPILYAGLVGLLAPSLASAARARAGRGPQVPVALVAGPLALLTAGLLTGARWADVELGWGGYWAWDPIESAGLVAWCCGAAALHGLAVERVRRGGDPGPVAGVLRRGAVGGRTAVALGLAPGLAALWATTATRVGLVSSVHAFADRPALRVGLLAVAALASVVALALIGLTGLTGEAAPVAPDAGPAPAAWRRRAVAVLAVAGLFVAVGAYEPLVEAGTTGDAVAIAGRYYSRLLWPVVMAGAALAVGADRRWGPALAGAAAAGATTPWGAGPYGVALAMAGGAVAGSALGRLWLQAGPPVAPDAPRSRRPGVGRALGHLGTGVLLVGVAGSMAGRVTTVAAPVGVPVRAGSVELVHEAIDLVDDGAATRSAVATVRIDGTELHPSLVSYRLRGVSTVELAHRYRWFDQLQVLLIDGDATSARYQVNELPRVGLVWLGGAVATAGLGATAATRRRHRGAPARTAEPAALAPADR
ncbi:MAG: cytochrome c biogenesis protein CcsA [Acidimicrobiales bacterium]